MTNFSQLFNTYSACSSDEKKLELSMVISHLLQENA